MDNLAVVIVAIFGSTGFWALLQYLLTRRDAKKSSTEKLLMALAQSRILEAGRACLKRGSISRSELAEIYAIYDPYKERGGNSLAHAMVEQIEELPIE